MGCKEFVEGAPPMKFELSAADRMLLAQIRDELRWIKEEIRELVKKEAH